MSERRALLAAGEQTKRISRALSSQPDRTGKFGRCLPADHQLNRARRLQPVGDAGAENCQDFKRDRRGPVQLPGGEPGAIVIFAVLIKEEAR